MEKQASEFYVSAYYEWKQGKSIITRIRPANRTFDKVLENATRETIEKYKIVRPSVSESMIRNFVIKLWYWTDLFLGEVIKEWSEQLNIKILSDNIVKPQEYLFCYFATLLGCDVLILNNRADININDKVRTLSSEIMLGSFGSIELPEHGKKRTTERVQKQIVQNSKKIEPKKLPHKQLAMVSVVNGEGLKTLFEQLGTDVVINCEDTMNASSQEFIEAFELIDADYIVVMPNNKNVILAAGQALEISGKKNVTILPTKSVAEGYFAIAMDVPDDKPEYRISSMKSGLQDVSTLVETTATRDYTYHELTCRKGEDIVLLNGELVCVSKDWCSGIIDGMKLVPDIDDKETCVVFYGDGVTEEQTDELRDRLEEEFPLLDVEFIDGGQKHYRLIIGLC